MEVAVDEEEETDSSANEEQDYGFAEVQSRTRYCNFKLLNEFQLINVGC